MKTLQKIRELVHPTTELTPDEIDAAAEAARIALDVIRPTIR